MLYIFSVYGQFSISEQLCSSKLLWALNQLNLSLCSSGEIQSQVQQAALVTFSSTSHCITLFYMCFCLNTPYVLYIVDSLTLNSLQMAHDLHVNKHYITHFLCKVRHSPLEPRNARQHFNHVVGSHFNQQNHTKKAQKCEEVALNRPEKGHLFIEELKREGRAENMHVG